MIHDVSPSTFKSVLKISIDTQLTTLHWIDSQHRKSLSPRLHLAKAFQSLARVQLARRFSLRCQSFQIKVKFHCNANLQCFQYFLDLFFIPPSLDRPGCETTSQTWTLKIYINLPYLKLTLFALLNIHHAWSLRYWNWFQLASDSSNNFNSFFAFALSCLILSWMGKSAPPPFWEGR